MNKKIILGIFCILVCFLVPIFSIESIIPWGFFIIFSKKIIKTIKEENEMKHIAYKCIFFTTLCLLLGVGFNYMVKYGTQLILKFVL